MDTVSVLLARSQMWRTISTIFLLVTLGLVVLALQQTLSDHPRNDSRWLVTAAQFVPLVIGCLFVTLLTGVKCLNISKRLEQQNYAALPTSPHLKKVHQRCYTALCCTFMYGVMALAVVYMCRMLQHALNHTVYQSNESALLSLAAWVYAILAIITLRHVSITEPRS